MKLADVKKLNKDQEVLVNLGYKFCGSKVYAHFKETEVVPCGGSGEAELCVVKPYKIADDKCGWAAHSIDSLMLVEPKQILQTI